MAERSSLYARITVCANQYPQMMSSPVTTGNDFDDWQRWFDSKNLTGDGLVPPAYLSVYEGMPLQQVVQWLCEPSGGNGRAVYDAHTGIWQLGVAQLTSIYSEMIPFLAVLRGCARFSQPDAGDFIAMYPYTGMDCDACIGIKDKQSRFFPELSTAQRQEADDFFISSLWASSVL